MKKITDIYEIKKSTSYLLKGIAIILMLIHHMFCFPEWIEIGGGKV